jgi:hypothetical protein
MNYDFKTNWNDVILPLLSHQLIKKSIKKGITNFIKDGQSFEEKYDCNKCPAEYSSNDGWFTYIVEFEDNLANKLMKTGFIKEEPIFEEDDCESEEYEEYKDKILEPFVKHHKKTSLRAYQMFGACHWWNPTFCLTLAKIIYPNEKWNILKGHYHTTVINNEETLIFDILYFDENDDTNGGQNAIKEANKALP